MNRVSQKRAFVQNHIFLGHSLVHGADSLSVIANIEQDDRPFFDITIRYAFKVYVGVPKKRVLGQTRFLGHLISTIIIHTL